VVTLLSFNRDQEREADEEALRVLAAEYGHVGGALDLFSIFAQVQSAQAGTSAPTVEFLATHPLTANRVEAVRRWAAAHGKAVEGPRRPLTTALARVRTQVDAERRKAEEERAKRP
jgi:predicted Zn-dependent protease